VRAALAAAVVAGALIAVQGALLGAMGERMHPFVAATWVHIAGLAFAIVGVLVARLGLDVDAIRQAPWGLLAGVAGMLLVTAIAIAVGGLGLASTLATVTGVQLLFGFTIEAMRTTDRLAALDPLRLVGAVLIVAGIYLVVSRAPASA
jgi:bacterial/archaeal transporter family-2 protein